MPTEKRSVPTKKPIPIQPRSDWFLEGLVRTVNDSGISFGITLVVGGSTITGTLVSGREYFDGFAHDFSSGMAEVSPDAAKQIAATIRQFGEKTYPTKPDALGPGANPRPVTFIHLKDARIVHPGHLPIPNDRGVLWRGRLSQVDGFCLGELHLQDDEESAPEGVAGSAPPTAGEPAK